MTPRALASLPKVPGCGLALSPRSIATIVLGLTPEALANSSWVIAWPRRSLPSLTHFSKGYVGTMHLRLALL